MAMSQLEVDKKNPILRKDRSSTGILDLDILLEGGYAKNSSIMLLGPTGMEKNAFSFHFADAGIKNKEKVLYLTSDSTPEDLLKKADSVGFDFRPAFSSGDLTFIDCYSATLGSKPVSAENVMMLDGPSSLNDLSVGIKELMESSSGKSIRLIFHSLSTFILYNPPDSILKFLQVVEGRARNAGATTLFLVEEGMHEKKLLASVEHLMDEKYIIHDGGNFALESIKLPMNVPLRLSQSGVEIGDLDG